MSPVATPPPLLRMTPSGLYCEAGDFFIDPWRAVDRAVITHAHSDHARAGSASYLAADEGRSILQHRLGAGAKIEGIAYGRSRSLRGVRVSLHPAGHIRGSAQVRVEHRGQVWVVTGDYKRAPDPTCTPFELVRCDTLITEATFAFPVYRWEKSSAVIDEIVSWYRECVAEGRTAILHTYSLGKAQRLLAELGPYVDGPVWVHGAIEPLNALYRDAGVTLPPTELVVDLPKGEKLGGALVLAPPSASTPAWMRRFRDPQTAFASGWMRLRGTRRRRALDRGFAISDHVDWYDLLQTVEESGASRVIATHGDSVALVRLLRERGIEASALETRFTGEDSE
ncbi:MAG: ligase-associated DNA damage response exonuclease [Gemmatimonadaceae bacterium]